jgi:hypothetical protein
VVPSRHFILRYLSVRGHVKTIRRIAARLIVWVIYWFLSAVVLWWAYDTNALIRGGFYQRNEAIVFVSKLALIIAVLALPIWMVRDRRLTRDSAWRPGWRVAWRTALVLVGYAALVVGRRQLWASDQGVSDYVMFLPIIGHVNGRFFSEFLWLVFVFQVIPITALASGALYYLDARVRYAATTPRTNQP